MAKRMLPAGIFEFKGQPIGPKPVIVDVGQKVPSVLPVRDGQTAFKEEIYLLVDGQGGLWKGGRSHCPALKTKNPPGAHR